MAHGQQDFVVTTQGDTLKGKIQIQLASEGHEEISINTEEGNRTLKAFQFLTLTHDDEAYKPVRYGQVYKIMKVETEGYLSLLHYRPEGQFAFGSPYLLKNTGEGIDLPTLTFKKVMSGFLSDCPEVVQKIEEKIYKKSDLTRIVTEYNQCITGQTEELFASDEDKSGTEDTSHPAFEIIQSLMEKANETSDPSAAEVEVLLGDLRKKLSSESKVPAYMIRALQVYARELPAMQQDINQLIDLSKK